MIRSVKFTTTKNGKKRAYRWCSFMMRWFPMPLAEAEYLVASGQVEDATGIWK